MILHVSSLNLVFFLIMDNDTGRSFAFNIAFTMRVNPPSTTPALSASEFWTGLRRGATSAQDFAEYIQDCIQLPGGKSATEFRRRLILAGGAVHSPAGVELEQDIRISEDLLVSIHHHAETSGIKR